MSVVFVDTETTGLDPDHNPIWEVAIIDGVHQQESVWQIRLTDREIALAHPAALEISGFHQRYGHAELYDREDVALLVARTIGNRHIVGAVPSFDEERLRRLCWSTGVSPKWHYHLVDVEAMAAGALGVAPPWNSEELSRGVGVEPAQFGRHTALGDAQWAKAIYEAVLEMAASREK